MDADDGYGNAINVMRTVEECEAAGVAALTIEDTALPQPYGLDGKMTMVSLEEGIGKMRAGLAARSDPNLVVLGRTSAPEIADMDEAILRLRAYAEAGVDALFPVGIKSREQLEALHAAVDKPIVLGGDSEELDDLSYLASQGVRVALQGHAPFAASIHAVYHTLHALKNGTSPSDLTGLADANLMNQATHRSDYDRWMKEFVR